MGARNRQLDFILAIAQVNAEGTANHNHGTPGGREEGFTSEDILAMVAQIDEAADAIARAGMH